MEMCFLWYNVLKMQKQIQLISLLIFALLLSLTPFCLSCCALQSLVRLRPCLEFCERGDLEEGSCCV